MTSIIVPIYNAESYLPACIESIVAQSERDLQIILVDDESTDGSLSIARRYATQDPRITILQQSHAGQSAARNLGLQHAKGEFIAFVDADDAIEYDWCEQHLNAIHGVDYVQSGYKRVEKGKWREESLPLHRYQFTSPCMRLYRRKTLQEVKFAEGYIYEDVLFTIDFWLHHPLCKLIPYAGYLYTLNPQSTTADCHPKDQERLFQALRAKYKKASLCGKIIIDYTFIRLKFHFLRS